MLKVFIDCGAPGLYNKLSRVTQEKGRMGSSMKDRKFDDFSYVRSKDYIQYREEYANFLLEHKSVIDVYPNLDVINNPELTRENQKYLESKGLDPLPVFHFGSDTKWLKQYLSEGYEYIAMGGMTPNPTSVLKPGLDNIWSNILTHKDGSPKVKVHGFAVTSIDLMVRYPWFSCDSTSWIKKGIYGFVIVPNYSYSRPDSLDFIRLVASERRLNDTPHVLFLKGQRKERIYEYIYSEGFEVRTGNKDKDICISDRARVELCGQVYLKAAKSVPEWPWAFQYKDVKRGFDL